MRRPTGSVIIRPLTVRQRTCITRPVHHRLKLISLLRILGDWDVLSWQVRRCGAELALTLWWSSICSSSALLCWRLSHVVLATRCVGACACRHPWVLVEFAGFTCPLTLLENDLRRRVGEAGYSGGFIDHCLIKVIYPPGLTHGVQIGLGVLVLLLAIIGYWGFVRSLGWIRAWRQPGPLGARPEHRNSRRRHQDVLVPADPHPAYQPIPTRRTSRSPTTHSCSFATAGKSPAAQLARARCLTSVSPGTVLSCPIPLVSLPAVILETAKLS